MRASEAVVDWEWENPAAGIATVTFSHPLDVVRTGFQVNDGRNSHLPSYKNTSHAVFTIARSEGLRGLYAGLYPAVLGSTISWGLYFYVYSKAKQVFILLQLQKQEVWCVCLPILFGSRKENYNFRLLSINLDHILDSMML